MRALFDLDIILEVIQKKEGEQAAASAVVSKVMVKELRGVLPAHALLRIFSLVQKESGDQQAYDMVDWFLVHFEIAAQGKEAFINARNMDVGAFEKALIASVAEQEECHYIITRDVAAFEDSAIPAITPEALLEKL